MVLLEHRPKNRSKILWIASNSILFPHGNKVLRRKLIFHYAADNLKKKLST
jgi:hypothetical protein